MKRGVVFSAWGEVSWEKTDYEYEYEHEQEHDEGEEGRKETSNVEHRTSKHASRYRLSVLSCRGSRGSSGKKSSPREAEPFRRAKLF
jgi:hypothetical protein